MRIGVDFDDVLNQFMKSFLNWHNRSHSTSLQFDQIYRYDFNNIVGISESELVDRVSAFDNSLDHMVMDPEVGALQVLPRLAKFHELQMITARSEKNRSFVDHWLENYFTGVFSKKHFTGYWGAKDPSKILSKADICRQLGLKVMIDDAPKTARDCLNVGLPVIMFDKPWNLSFPNHELLTRVTSWYDVENVLESYKYAKSEKE